MSNYNLFESYIFNKISEDQRREFDERLSSDSDFREDFEEHKQVQESLNILVEEDVSKVIDRIKEKSKPSTTASAPQGDNIKTIVPRRWLSIAAALLFLVAFTFIINNKLSATKHSMAVADLVHLNIENPRSADNVKNVYQSQCIEVNALIQKEEWPQAAVLLNLIINTSKVKTYKEEAEWNLAVIYAQYDKEKSLAILNNILADPEHGYNDFEKVKPLKESIQ